MTTPKTLFVRLKPYNPAKGFVVQRLVVQGVRFMAGHWYEVNAKLATVLSTIHETPDNLETPLAFDILSREQAKALEAKELATAARANIQRGEVAHAELVRTGAEDPDPQAEEEADPEPQPAQTAPDLSTADLKQTARTKKGTTRRRR